MRKTIKNLEDNHPFTYAFWKSLVFWFVIFTFAGFTILKTDNTNPIYQIIQSLAAGAVFATIISPLRTIIGGIITNPIINSIITYIVLFVLFGWMSSFHIPDFVVYVVVVVIVGFHGFVTYKASKL